MSAEVDRDSLIGKWVHSHEEDVAGARVFRPAGYRFPPSRGRRSLALHGDGTAVSGGPGPDDRAAEKPMRWHLSPENSLSLVSPGGGTEHLHIVQLSQDKLVVADA